MELRKVETIHKYYVRPKNPNTYHIWLSREPSDGIWSIKSKKFFENPEMWQQVKEQEVLNIKKTGRYSLEILLEGHTLPTLCCFEVILKETKSEEILYG
jgi:hypothetical protein